MLIFFLHNQSLLASHDVVAQRDYLPKLGEIPLEVDEDEETVKMVQLVKSQDPTVINNNILTNITVDKLHVYFLQGESKGAEPIVVCFCIFN